MSNDQYQPPANPGPYQQMLTAAQNLMIQCLQNPKPTYTVEGKSFSWIEYQKFLQGQIDWARERVMDEEEGPWEHETRILT